jgi:hypothetical protein
MVDARCKDMPYEESLVVFFPDKGQNAREGKRICNGTQTALPCPVRDQCLAYALSFEPEGVVGIFGGTTVQERRAMYNDILVEQGSTSRPYHNLENLEPLVQLVRKVNRGR